MPASLESTMALTTKVNDIGFVEFTTGLVKNVYETVVQSSLDQLRGYAELVKDVSQTLAEYQKSVGLGISADPTATENESLLTNCQNYAVKVLQLTTTGNNGDAYSLTANDNPTLIEAINAIHGALDGFDADPAAESGTIKELIKAADATGTTLTLDASKSATLHRIIALKLRSEAADNYNMLTTILKLGLQKIVIERGLIATKITFKVDATETASRAESTLSTASKGFALSGGATAKFAKWGGRISGGYSSNKLNVSVVNENTSAVASLNVDIVGEVRIEFRTDSFPSIGG